MRGETLEVWLELLNKVRGARKTWHLFVVLAEVIICNSVEKRSVQRFNLVFFFTERKEGHLVYWFPVNAYLRKILVCPICWLANPGYWRIECNCFYFHEWGQLQTRKCLIIQVKGYKGDGPKNLGSCEIYFICLATKRNGMTIFPSLALWHNPVSIFRKLKI